MRIKRYFQNSIVILVVFISGCSGIPKLLAGGNNTVILEGEGLLNDRCVECHSLTRVVSARFSLEKWTTVVDRMLRKDIPMTSEERQVLIDYLYQNYPSAATEVEPAPESNSPEIADEQAAGAQLLNIRCVECHNLRRVTRQALTLEEWRILVDSMILEGAVLNLDEKEVLVQYLAETYPAE